MLKNAEQQLNNTECSAHKPQVCNKKTCMAYFGTKYAHMFSLCTVSFVLYFALSSDSHSLHYVAAHYVLAYSGLALCAFTLRKIRCAKRNGAKNKIDICNVFCFTNLWFGFALSFSFYFWGE